MNEEIIRLLDLFSRNREAYLNPKYNETQLRREFLDPFFESIGWDITNKQGIAEQYKEVIHEDSIMVSGSKKAPDYCFRIGSERKFFVEAKKPSVSIKEDSECAFQLRRYGWSAKLGLSILTNFREFAVYDCRIKPSLTDKASTARIMYFTLENIGQAYKAFHDIFAKESVWKGSFDIYSKANKSKKGTATVDEDFLEVLEEWRITVAKNLIKMNDWLSQRDLNYSVQRTLDRILFLRISEDRGLENPFQLKEITEKKNTYKELCKLFLHADEKYNSGLFHFHKENDRPEPPDELSLRLIIEDKILKDIISDLYYPKSAYEFSVMPVEILGQVYEQFLGKYLKVSGNRVTVEEKPIVKKAGGVFYTPDYIVNEIVKESIAPLLKDKTPEQVEKIKIVDPACGSGSFLLGAYEFLLKWHLDFFLANKPDSQKGKVHKNKNGKWVLDSTEKKRILLANIYGVDIDAQAVETTKLSLLLKVLEDETNEAISKQLSLFKERALPDLGFNIKCGNSLVSSNLFKLYDANTFDDDTIFKINPFDWDQEFPSVFNRPNPGFDAVVGNPPYVRVQLLSEVIPFQADYVSEVYKSASFGNFDIYVTFVEKGLELLRKSGNLGFILPHKFFNAEYGQPLRTMLADKECVNKIVHFGDQQVFDQATTYTCLLYLTNKKIKNIAFEKVVSLDEWRSRRQSEKGIMKASELTSEPWVLINTLEKDLMERVVDNYPKLETLTSRIFQGLKTGCDKCYIVKLLDSSKGKFKIYSKQTLSEHEVEKELFHPLIKGGDSRDFVQSHTERLILFPYLKQKDGTTRSITEFEMRKNYPLTYKYLKECKEVLVQRDNGDMGAPGVNWLEYSRTQALEVISKRKIFTPDIAPKPEFSIDNEGETFFTGGVSGGYGILPKDEDDYYFLLGLLNSDFTNWFIRKISTPMRGGYYSFESKYIKHIPIPKCDSGLKTKISEKSKSIFELSKVMLNMPNASDAKILNKKRCALLESLNKLVNEAYELNADEVLLINGDLANTVAS